MASQLRVFSQFIPDRRRYRRYSMRLGLQYEVHRADGHVRERREGVTINISSRGICFEGNEVLPLGTEVRLAISWPLLLEGRCRLKLITFGRVVRTHGTTTAIMIQRYEFRTAGTTDIQSTCAQKEAASRHVPEAA